MILLKSLIEAVEEDCREPGISFTFTMNETHFDVNLETDEGTFLYGGQNPEQFMNRINQEVGFDLDPIWSDVQPYIDAFWAILNEYYRKN